MILYDREKDYRGIPPYRHSRYKSIYEGIQIEIQIVDNCNLNCSGCNHFSPCLRPWQISIEDFRNNLIKAKDNIPNIKSVFLIGGEPSLHKDLISLCEITREVFPEARIQINSNGIYLAPFENNIKKLEKNNIEVCFTLYPGYSKEDGIKNFISKYENGRVINKRVLMGQTLINKIPENASDNFFVCRHYALPCFTIRDFKLYFCPFSAHIRPLSKQYNLNIPESKNDFLYLDEIKNNLDLIQEFCFTPKDICSYCKKQNFTIPWSKEQYGIKQYYESILDLYKTDYELYLKILNNREAYMNNKQSTADVLYDTDIDSNDLASRFGEGKIDIIIPYYTLSSSLQQQLIKTLSSQSIIQDCVIYFISDNSPDEDSLIKLVSNSNLNAIFLKNEKREGPGVARNIGVKNSFNKYILFLDSDDYFLRDDALEFLFNTIQNEDLEMVHFPMLGSDYSVSFASKNNYILSRDFILSNNLFFIPLFYAEDYNYYIKMMPLTKKFKQLNNKDLICWNRDNKDSLTNQDFKNEFVEINKAISKIITLFENIQYNYPKTQIFKLYLDLIEDFRNYESDEVKLIIIYSLYKYYLLDTDNLDFLFPDTVILFKQNDFIEKIPEMEEMILTSPCWENPMLENGKDLLLQVLNIQN